MRNDTSGESPGRDRSVATCTRCGLAEGRSHVVLGWGSPRARVAFVIDAPGYRADRSGAGLDGPAGEWLLRALGEVGLGPDDVLVTYLVKCRPPDSRRPADHEIAACEPHLFAELVAAEPELLCPMGSVAAGFLTGSAEDIGRLRGRRLEARLGGRDVACLPLVHPAAAAAIPEVAELLVADLARIPAILAGEPDAPPTPLPAPTMPPQPSDDQMALFG